MKYPRALVPALIAVLVVGFWEWFVRSGRVDDVLVPAPTQIAAWFWSALCDGSLASATWVTMRRLTLGFVMGAAIGIPVGALCARSRLARDTIGVLSLVCRPCLPSAGCRSRSSPSARMRRPCSLSW